MILPVSDPRLRMPCLAVKIDRDGAELIDTVARDLRLAMAWSAAAGRPALGLAAPQIGHLLRVFVLRDFPLPFVNPAVVELGPATSIEDEGCLSLPPAALFPVERATLVKAESWTTGCDKRIFKLRDRDARAFLHELDHLDGVLVTDRARAEAKA